MLVHDRATPLARRRTPEGFLEVRARIGRAGLHDYRAGEIGGPPGARPDAPVRVYRPPDEVFDPASLSSFAGKPVTQGHPATMVDSANWRVHAVGHSGQGVVRDGDHVAADLLVTDAAAVAVAEAGSELSNGYWADFDFTPGTTPEGEPYDALQRNIRGNHIALVDRGRCGPSCALPSGGGTADAAAPGANPPAAAGVSDRPPGGEAALRQLGGEAALVSQLRADVEARDGEIAALRARMAEDAASLDRRAAERVAVVDLARGVLGPDFDPAGLDLDEVRRTALVRALGAEAVRGRGDAYVAAAFDTLAALSRHRRADALSERLAADPASPLAALQARNAALAGAWKPDQGDR